MIHPKDKAFLDIKLVQECMDAHAKRMAASFGDWLYKNYTQCDITDKWKECARITQHRYTSDQLYNKFIESITK